MCINYTCEVRGYMITIMSLYPPHVYGKLVDQPIPQ